MLSKTNSAREANLRLVEKAIIHAHGVPVREILDVPLPKGIDGHAIKAYRLGADLLVVTDDDDLPRDVLKEQGLWTRLAGLINDRHIEKVGGWLGSFGHPINWHHPGWDGSPTIVEMVARLLSVLRGILPGTLSDLLDG